MLFSDNSQKPAAGPLAHPDQFVRRHIGPNVAETLEMLKLLGCESLDALTDAAVPKQIRLAKPLNLPAALSARTHGHVVGIHRRLAAQAVVKGAELPERRCE